MYRYISHSIIIGTLLFCTACNDNDTNDTPPESDTGPYNIGDIIHYPGKCYDHNDFYAYIYHITNTGISITVLLMEEEDNNVIFYNTSKEYDGLTTRKFNLFSQ